MLPGTLEWHAGAALLAAVAFFWWPAGVLLGMALTLSVIVAVLQAAQATLAPAHERLSSRLLVAALCYAQPLVRSWRRYRTRLFSYGTPMVEPASSDSGAPRLPLTGACTVAYWSEEGCERTHLLGLFIAHLVERHWGTAVDSGWSHADVEVHYHPWTFLEVCTAQEDHGGGKHLVRVGYRLRLSGFLKGTGSAALLLGGAAAALRTWPSAAGAALLLGGVLALWWAGTRRAAQALAVFDVMAARLGLVRCETEGADADR